MEDLYKSVLEKINQKGSPQVENLDYKLTESSLNSDFSFKFESLQEFVTFCSTES